MAFPMISFIIICLASFSSCHVPNLPDNTCSVEKKACKSHNGNLIDRISNVTTFEECKQLCKADVQCEMVSHRGPNSFPARNNCYLFKRCDEMEDCTDCRTQTREDCGNCFIDKVGDISNPIKMIDDVPDEQTCLKYCRRNPNCRFYTYFLTNASQFANDCFLLADVEAPVKPCDHCRTGFPICKKTCHFSVETDTNLTSYKFTNTSVVTPVDFPTEALFSECQLTVVAVGGGGAPDTIGGGGSGYVEHQTIPLLDFRRLLVTVGSKRNNSIVTRTDGEVLITAEAGEDGNNIYKAGGGYSGGGGNSGSGGFNGLDGLGSYSGKGSGVDISSIILQHFQLTPGAGGLPCSGGGGGGGVLVDLQGPGNPSPYDGKGYGGGQSKAGISAQQGIVLIEIRPKPV